MRVNHVRRHSPNRRPLSLPKETDHKHTKTSATSQCCNCCMQSRRRVFPRPTRVVVLIYFVYIPCRRRLWLTSNRWCERESAEKWLNTGWYPLRATRPASRRSRLWTTWRPSRTAWAPTSSSIFRIWRYVRCIETTEQSRAAELICATNWRSDRSEHWTSWSVCRTIWASWTRTWRTLRAKWPCTWAKCSKISATSCRRTCWPTTVSRARRIEICIRPGKAIRRLFRKAYHHVIAQKLCRKQWKRALYCLSWFEFISNNICNSISVLVFLFGILVE